MHLLIAYIHSSTHVDPLFEEFTYGDSTIRGRRLKECLRKGDYVFFHIGKDRKKFITAYYLIDRVLFTEEAVKDSAIIAKYKNVHIERFLAGRGYPNDVLIFGDPSGSKILDKPLLFDKNLAEKLSLSVKFHDNRTENQDITSATRNHRKLTDEDVAILFKEIDLPDRPALTIVSAIEENKGRSNQKLTETSKIPIIEVCERPQWLLNLMDDILKLKNDSEHKERAHESLVESFYELLGFTKFTDIKHRQGRIDISIEHEGRTLIVTEVKKDWNLSHRDKSTMIQAYNYSLESGARFVIVTNGDYYAIFDKNKGHSYESNFLGEFKLSRLKKDNLGLIDKFRKENILEG